MQSDKIYAGIGSRETPVKILCLMRIIGVYLASKGYTLHTGAAQGADQAFAEGAISAGGDVSLFLPWPEYEANWRTTLIENESIKSKIFIYMYNPNVDKEATQSVYRLHPVGDRLKNSIVALHARNYLIVKNANSIICYTKDGVEAGGTGQGIRIAREMGKRVYNLGKTEDLQKILCVLKKQDI